MKSRWLLVVLFLTVGPIAWAQSITDPPPQWQTLQLKDLILGHPAGLVVDESGNVFVCDPDHHHVLKIAPDSSVTVFGGPGTKPGQFNSPEDLALDSRRMLYIADRGNDRIQLLDAGTGRFYKTIGSRGKNRGQFNLIGGIDIAPNGDLYVADEGNCRIQVFNPDGRLLFTFGKFGLETGLLNRPHDVVTDGETVYVADMGNDRIQAFSSDGHFKASFGSRGSELGQFLMPTALSLAPNGDLYVADYGNSRVQIIRFHRGVTPEPMLISGTRSKVQAR